MEMDENNKEETTSVEMDENNIVENTVEMDENNIVENTVEMDENNIVENTVEMDENNIVENTVMEMDENNIVENTVMELDENNIVENTVMEMDENNIVENTVMELEEKTSMETTANKGKNKQKTRVNMSDIEHYVRTEEYPEYVVDSKRNKANFRRASIKFSIVSGLFTYNARLFGLSFTYFKGSLSIRYNSIVNIFTKKLKKIMLARRSKRSKKADISVFLENCIFCRSKKYYLN